MHDLILQQPPGAAQQLVLLYHGAGGEAADMAYLGSRIAQRFPAAWIVSIGAPLPCPAGGRQWFEPADLADEHCPARIDAALPAFLDSVRHWQERSGVPVAATALLGFSQGADMALAASQVEPPVAGRIASFAGRFARLPERATKRVTLHLLHGKSDAVVAYAHTITATEHILELQGDATADVVPFVGHEINAEMADLLLERLTGYVPRRLWDEALGDAGAIPMVESARRDH